MKLACQDRLVPGANIAEKFTNLEKWGFDGVELGGAVLVEQFDEIKEAAKKSKVKPSTVCGGYRGWLLAADLDDQKLAVEDIKRLLEYCAELGMTGLIAPTIYGSSSCLPLPKRPRSNEEDMKILVDSLVDIGERAKQLGTTLLLEPLNRYETHLIHTLEEGLEVLEKVNNPGVKLMGDFFHMQIEEACLSDSIRKAGSELCHIHLADSNRHWPGRGHLDFALGFAALKEIGFDKYMAIECWSVGDPYEELPKAAKFLRSLID